MVDVLDIFNPKLNGYSVKKLVNARDSLCSAFECDPEIMRSIGDPLTDTAPIMVPLIAERIGVSESVVMQSLLSLLRDVQDGPLRKDYKKAIWILLCNKRALLNEVPLQPFSKVTALEWLPVYVTDVNVGVHKGYNVRGSWIKFLFIGGPAVTSTFSYFCNNTSGKNFLRYIMFDLGRFNKLADVTEFVGMQAWILLNPDKCDNSIRFERVGLDASMRSSNRLLMRERLAPCSDYQHECYKCHIGSGECWLATHSATYVLRSCTRCGNKKGWFESDSGNSVCIPCRNNIRLGKDLRHGL